MLPRLTLNSRLKQPTCLSLLQRKSLLSEVKARCAWHCSLSFPLGSPAHTEYGFFDLTSPSPGNLDFARSLPPLGAPWTAHSSSCHGTIRPERGLTGPNRIRVGIGSSGLPSPPSQPVCIPPAAFNADFLTVLVPTALQHLHGTIWPTCLLAFLPGCCDQGLQSK